MDKRPCACGCGQIINTSNKYGRKNIRFVHGHNGRGRLHYDYKGGKYINDAGYVMVLRPDHPRASSNGYVREHILVMEAYLGRPLKRTENVHHINHNRADNRIENLQRFDTQSDHIAEHKGTNKLGPKICYNCNRSDARRYCIDNEKQKWICRNCYRTKLQLRDILAGKLVMQINTYSHKFGTDGQIKHRHTYTK